MSKYSTCMAKPEAQKRLGRAIGNPNMPLPQEAIDAIVDIVHPIASRLRYEEQKKIGTDEPVNRDMFRPCESIVWGWTLKQQPAEQE